MLGCQWQAAAVCSEHMGVYQDTRCIRLSVWTCMHAAAGMSN